MYLQANPTKARSEEEKKELNTLYKPGDNVLPKLRRRGGRGDDEEEQRVLNEVMVQSLHDAGISGSTSDGNNQRQREQTSRQRGPSVGASTRSEGRQAGLLLHTREEPRARARPVVRDDPRVSLSRSLDHQSSLRSLLSVSEEDIEEDILRHIMEDGLLDGVDLNNMTTAQEDELSERIAAAYKRRQDEQRRARRAAATASHPLPDRSNHRSRERSRHSSRPRVIPSTNSATETTSSPVQIRSPDHFSPPQILVPTASRQELSISTSNGSRHRSASADNSTSLSIPRQNGRPGARSASNLPLPVQGEAFTSGRPPVAYNNRRSTEPTSQTLDENPPVTSTGVLSNGENPVRPHRAESDGLAAIIPSGRPLLSPRRNSHTFPMESSRPRSSHSAVSAISGISDIPATELPGSLPLVTTSAIHAPVSPQFLEPHVSCERCKTTDIQYELHHACFKCSSSGYNLCDKCYRHGEGCLHWFGFGWGAWQKFHRSKSATGAAAIQPPHIMKSRRYKRPGDGTHVSRESQGNSVADLDLASRLETGVFCDICRSSANNWYWRCDVCNEGEWGYCNACVNRGKHCTHPLLSLSYSQTPSSSPTLSQFPHTSSVDPSISFTPKSFTTQCDICSYSIPPSNTRYHCSKCNNGDYDIHTSCYTSLVKSGRISSENGNKGWRRCLNGHRMVIVGFEDRQEGQKRIVDRDIAGGEALKEDEASAMTIIADTTPGNRPSTPPSKQSQNPGWRWTDADGTTRFLSPSVTSPSPMPSPSVGSATQLPPDGGVGLRLQAKWGYYPSEPDELMFPKGAEIKEAEDINGDWYWGVYAGAKGLFPGNYGRVIGRR